VVLQSVSDLFREPCLSSKRLPGSPQIAVCHDGDDLAIALAPHERIERAMADRLGRVGCGWKKPAKFIRLDRPDKLGRDLGHGDGVRLSILSFGPIDDALGRIPLIDV